MTKISTRIASAALAALWAAAAAPGQTYDVLHPFDASGQSYLEAPLIIGPDGNFYGTTEESTPTCPQCGTVFRMTPSGQVETLHEFAPEDGRAPHGLIFASNGDLYGLTKFGGSETCSCGTAFRIDSSRIFTVVHTFEGTDGALPWGLIEPEPGDLWGTTQHGGTCESQSQGCGTVFRMHLNGDLQTMHAFDGVEGEWPGAGLVLAEDGNLYGSTYGARLEGGCVVDDAPHCGTVYRVTLNGNVSTVHAFEFADGAAFPGELVVDDQGDLVGTAYSAGPAPDNGRIFRLSLAGTLTPVHVFDGDGHEGVVPSGAILQADDGRFYGVMSYGGASGGGTIYQVGADGDGFQVIHDFEEAADGAHPIGGMIQSIDGRLYGTTTFGGSAAGGVVYRVTLPGLLRFFCPDSFVRRDQMAVFLLKIAHGADYVPPACTAVFGDVACPSLFADWVEQLAAEGTTAGCSGGNYCPLSPVTRGQMAVFLLKTEHGPDYTPPSCTGVFPDVPCPSLFAAWIEQLAAEGVTAGCGGGNFCPDSPVTRAQMAVFLLKVEHGPAFAPPPCAGRFTDVACPSGFAAWIEQLYLEGITAGCSGPAAPEP